MNIFFDLDGTLLDVSKKYYSVHLEAIKTINHLPLSFKKYWQAKKNKISEDKMLNLGAKTKKFVLYEKERVRLLEEKKFLKLDKPFPWVYELLGQLKLKNKLYVITVRRNKESFFDQLKLLKLSIFFAAILSAKPTDNPVLTKERLIKKVKFNKNDILIGDTEVDILVAQKLGLKLIAVSSGIRTKSFLKQFKPDFLVQDARFLYKLK